MADLTTEFVGLKLRNPVVVAPAAITETVERMKRCEDNGAGAVVVKSYFEREYMRRSPTPRFAVLHQRAGRERAFTLYSYEQSSIYDLQRYAEEIRRAKEALAIPVIASIACVTDQGWADSAAACQQAGADALELNTSCPHGFHIMSDRDLAADMAHSLEAARSTTSIPLIPKMTGQLSNPTETAVRLEEAGADGLVIFNRFTGLDLDIEAQRPIMHGGFAGHGGPWSLHYVLRWIVATAPRLSIPIAASGGVARSDDVVKLILAGAQVVQTCTAVVLRGYAVIGRLVEGLERYLERKGYQTCAEFRGLVCNRVLGAEQVERSFRQIAAIEQSRCVSCNQCYAVCIYDAVKRDGGYQVRPEVCDGCGLCVQVCPAQCIGMVERPADLPLPRQSTPQFLLSAEDH